MRKLIEQVRKKFNNTDEIDYNKLETALWDNKRFITELSENINKITIDEVKDFYYNNVLSEEEAKIQLISDVTYYYNLIMSSQIKLNSSLVTSEFFKSCINQEMLSSQIYDALLRECAIYEKNGKKYYIFYE